MIKERGFGIFAFYRFAGCGFWYGFRGSGCAVWTLGFKFSVSRVWSFRNLGVEGRVFGSGPGVEGLSVQDKVQVSLGFRLLSFRIEATLFLYKGELRVCESLPVANPLCRSLAGKSIPARPQCPNPPWETSPLGA